MNEKIERVRSFLKENKFDGMLISRQSNFSWLSNGGRGHVAISSESSVASFFVTLDDIYLISNNIESKRLQEEELKDLDCHIKEHFWYDNEHRDRIIQHLFSGKQVCSDLPVDGATNVAGKIAELRYILTQHEVENYKELGKHCGEAICKVCKSVKSGMSEFEIAGIISSELYSRGIDPIVLLIAVDDRVSRYRHPLPTEKRVEKYGMIVVCGRKYGLIASVTRLFHFGPLSQELRQKHNAVVEVDTVFIAESRPGAIVGDILLAAQNKYAEKGFAHEWKLHHQGGPASYDPRDYTAIPGLTKKLLK
ncbi:M24 family metallopeptidase, partial [Candidatus Poribacteria bacterium]|nr:M24 family metallopeptidase [Candidatus Poribacteria bacterium]